MITASLANDLQVLAVKSIKEDYLRLNGSNFWQTAHTNNMTLRTNCLPAHLAIIEKVRKMKLGGKPIVVIGVMGSLKRKPTNEEQNHIKDALFLQRDPHEDYHAWIQLDADDMNSEILDITGPYWLELETHNGYFNKESALNHNIVHYPILTDEMDVYSYHASVVYDHIIHYGSLRQQKAEIIWYLTNFSRQQNVIIDKALGYAGKTILNESVKCKKNDGLWNKILKLLKPRA
ncbi:hypothetical protein [Shewanella frigidimarina]|uniref:hypothetical protein n=1 Tax=Shewanella frigidimarina TaxID=56812 RepID=UPI003D7BA7F4